MINVEKVLCNGFKFVNKEEKIKLSGKYKVLCPNNHLIFIRLDNLINRLHRKSKGCPECHKKELENQSLTVTLKHIPKDFKLIGSYRKDVNWKDVKTLRYYKFECPSGHLFERDSGHIKDLTCPKCSEQVFVGQERTRKIFQELFNVEFLSIRPDWLKNPKTGKNLELDGYNEHLRIGFEFQGRQHLNSNTQYQDDYKKQKERDETKRKICEELGINLIEVEQPSSYAPDKFIINVIEQIKEKIDITQYPKISFNIPKNRFNFVELNYQRLMPNVELFLKFCVDESPIKGYMCKNTEFHTYEDSIEMICPKGHTFSTTPAEFKRNILGKKGRHVPCIVCYGEENRINTKIDLNYCINEGLIYGLKLIDKNYKNVNEKMKWVSDSGEMFELSFRQIQRSKTKVFK